MNTPVVIFLYRRPAHVNELLVRLQLVRPARVWLVADGPKDTTEKSLCEQARQAAEAGISWPCQIVRLYSDTNLGLKKRIETGLDQVFEHEEEVIILEEDCHPTPNFFLFCEAMLE